MELTQLDSADPRDASKGEATGRRMSLPGTTTSSERCGLCAWVTGQLVARLCRGVTCCAAASPARASIASSAEASLDPALPAFLQFPGG